MLTLNYRFRIYPDISQQEMLVEWMEICRSAYNYALREIKDWCDSRKCLVDRCSLEKEYILAADLKFPTEVNQLNSLPKAKKEFPRLWEVPSQVLQQAIKQLHRGWEYFQERGFGFPRFKKYGQFKSLLFPQFKENPVTSSHVKLPKIGAISINLHRPIPDGFVVKQVRIIRKADRWYVSINLQLDVNVPSTMPQGHPIGIDIGLSKYLATSEGEIVRPPKFFKQKQSELKLLQRRLSRKQNRSKNYEKARIKVARLHHEIDNTRKDFHFKQAHKLCDAGDMIFMEDLDYARLAKGMLGKHMLDGAFGQFRTIVQYVCWKRGKFFAVVDARGTSQLCPECGAEVRKDLSIRVHNCSGCGYTTDRDVASSQVIRNRGIALISSTLGHSGIESACAVGLSGAEETQSRSEAKSRKGVTRKSSK
ncbi:MAG: IS200/IS605 family transposase ISSoc12 [Chroococcidiopsis sp. SAG 2025]|uniref:RNA-guided endonuclease InsQ/TnpB family protein n=1 Tax=Chroococcidiopsis sp. SAG 2025 TaxID=171389 RepID=UPI002936DE0E|nr:transposase [Chroococcidiopsis sp. SAG 2025]MDV2997330.1 IS200/IS605 family transposase ISSoc12 [Chroococcidiopsis sp. SAG 2025]